MNEKLALKISMLPEDPGVYVMLDADGNVIYVGKAKVLKNRVKQYFYSNKKPRKRFMLPVIPALPPSGTTSPRRAKKRLRCRSPRWRN